MPAAKKPAKRLPVAKKATKDAKSRGGRPPKPPGEKLVQRSIRLGQEHWDKIDENGGPDWLRKVIDAQ
jgi:hypothetical protein